MSTHLCPICHSTSVSISSRGYSPKIHIGNGYVSDLTDVSFYFCNTCNSGWRDNDSSLSYLYGVQQPLHNKGLNRYVSLLQGSPWDCFYKGIPSLLRIAADTLNRPLDIVEFGCPINSIGYLTEPFAFSLPPLRNNYRKYKGMLRIYDFLSSFPNIFSYLVFFYGRLKGFLRTCRPVHRDTQSFDPSLVSKLSFVPLLSRFGWGANCSIVGKPCFLASCEFGLNRHYLIPSTQSCHADLGFSLNFIDHTDNPLQFVADSLEHCDILFFNVHRQHFAGPQHKYTLSPLFAQVCQQSKYDITCMLLESSAVSSPTMLTFLATRSPNSTLFKSLISLFAK